jgi:hypothetical protein
LGHSPPRRTRKQEYMRWWQGRGGRQRWAGIGNAGPVTWSLVDLYKDFGFTSFVIRPPWQASHQWLIPVILGTQRTDQEAEIRRIVVQSQPWANSSSDPILKIPNRKQGWWSGLPSKREALSSSSSAVKTKKTSLAKLAWQSGFYVFSTGGWTQGCTLVLTFL